MGEGVGGSICRVLRGSEALGGSFVRVSRVGEAFGGSPFLTNLDRLEIPGGSAKERPSRAWGEGEGERGEARSVMFYEGLRFWEARFVMFYEGLRLWGGSGLNEALTNL